MSSPNSKPSLAVAPTGELAYSDDGRLQEPAEATRPIGPGPFLRSVRSLWTKVAAGARSLVDGRAVVALSPAVLALAVLPFTIPLMRLELNEPLFGDTYVFQYTGWCLRHGLRL